MHSSIEELMVVLEDMGFKRFKDENLSQDAIKILFDLASRDEPAELLLTLISSSDVTLVQQHSCGLNLLNVIYFFPEELDIDTIQEAKFLSNQVNAATFLPGFGVDAANKKIYYRYSIPFISFPPNNKLLKETIDLIIDIINIYSELFIQVINGISYKNVIEEALTNYVANVGLLLATDDKKP
jgi:hypothetical protein